MNWLWDIVSTTETFSLFSRNLSQDWTPGIDSDRDIFLPIAVIPPRLSVVLWESLSG